jgi:hypothetical protein
MLIVNQYNNCGNSSTRQVIETFNGEANCCLLKLLSLQNLFHLQLRRGMLSWLEGGHNGALLLLYLLERHTDTSVTIIWNINFLYMFNFLPHRRKCHLLHVYAFHELFSFSSPYKNVNVMRTGFIIIYIQLIKSRSAYLIALKLCFSGYAAE